MRWRLCGILTALLMVPVAGLQAQPATLRVGIVLDGTGAREEQMARLFVAEISRVISGSVPAQFPEGKRIAGDGTPQGARQALHRLFFDPEVDLVLALGYVASQEAARMGPLPKPVIAAMVMDASLQGLPRTEAGGTGVKNLNYLTLPDQLARDLKVFRDVVRFRRVDILVGGPPVSLNIKYRVLRSMASGPWRRGS